MFGQNLKKIRAQSTLEYAVMVALIAAALLTMQTYIKRGIQGRLKDTADELGQQYDPGSTTADITTTSSSNMVTVVETEELSEDKMQTTTTVVTSEDTQVSGNETIGPMDQ